MIFLVGRKAATWKIPTRGRWKWRAALKFKNLKFIVKRLLEKASLLGRHALTVWTRSLVCCARTLVPLYLSFSHEVREETLYALKSAWAVVVGNLLQYMRSRVMGNAVLKVQYTGIIMWLVFSIVVQQNIVLQKTSQLVSVCRTNWFITFILREDFTVGF